MTHCLLALWFYLFLFNFYKFRITRCTLLACTLSLFVFSSSCFTSLVSIKLQSENNGRIWNLKLQRKNYFLIGSFLSNNCSAISHKIHKCRPHGSPREKVSSSPNLTVLLGVCMSVRNTVGTRPTLAEIFESTEDQPESSLADSHWPVTVPVLL